MSGIWRRPLHRRDLLRASVLATTGLAGVSSNGGVATATVAQPRSRTLLSAQGSTANSVTLHHPSWAGPNGNQMHLVQRLVFDRLYDQAHDGAWLPALAEKWSWNDDATSITFSLRQGVTFHDGTPFTAKDVVTSVKVIASSHLGGDFARLRPLTGVEAYGDDQAEEITGLKIIDDHTITFEFDRQAAGFFAYSAFGRDGVNIVPAHIWEPQIAAARSGEISLKEPNNSWYWSADANIGTGPFTYAEGRPEEFMRLEAASQSWRGRPKLDSMLWQNFGEADTQFLAFQSGEIDISTYQPEFDEQVAQMSDVQVDEFTTPFLQILDVNCRDDGFGLPDARVRQALSCAINREAINDGLYNGFHTPLTSVLQGEWNNAQAPQFPYNVDQAKQLLQESGFDTSRELVLAYDYPDTLPQRTMEAIQADLQAVGFKTRLLHLEGPAAEETRGAGEWTTWLNGFAAHYSPYVIALALRTDGAQNDSGAGSPELDELFTRAETLSDPAAQTEIWAEIQTLAQTETYLIPLWRRGTKVAYRTRVRGWDTNTTAAFSVFNFHYFGAEKWEIA